MHPSHRLLTLVLTLALCTGSVFAQDATDFRSLVTQRQRADLKAVVDYIANNLAADDANDARTWILETAVSQGLEDEAISTARYVLDHLRPETELRGLALQCLCVGHARAGDQVAAQEAYTQYLRGLRMASPYKALDIATILSARAQLEGNADAVAATYESFGSILAIRPQTAELVENRRARLDAWKKPAPVIESTDLKGESVSLASFQGKVVLVDFWATNCAPCLAELPNLKRLHRQYQSQGFEIVGVSLDDNASTVNAFTTAKQVSWRQVLQPAGRGDWTQKFKVQTIPALFLVDRDGKVAFVDTRGDELKLAVEKLVAAPAKQ